MSEWKEYKLGEICDVRDGTHDSPKESKDGKPLVTSKNIKDGKLDLSNTYLISYEDYNQINKRSRVDKWDILFSMIGTIGESTIVNFDPNFAIKNVALFKTSDEHIAKWIYYYLKSSDAKAEINANIKGSTQQYISLADLRNFPILVPSLELQKQIVGILSLLDDKIDLLNRQNQTLESMAEALFRHYFIDNAQPEWEEKTLGDFILVKHGFAFKGEYISSETTNQILITPGNFKIGGGFKSDKLKYYSDNNYSEEYLLNTDDLIVTMTDLSVNGDTLGYGALVPVISLNEKYLHNQRIGKVVFKQQIGKYFIYYLMKTEDYQWFILSGASGTSIRHTSPSSICSYSFKLPEQIKINEFERLASSIQEKIKYNQTQINTLSNLRNTLLPKLMNREVEITEEMT